MSPMSPEFLYCYIYYIFYYDHEKEKTAFCMREAEKAEKDASE